MADTSYGVNDAEAVKLWSKKLFHDALKTTFAYRFMGNDSGSLIQVLSDTRKGQGDRVRCILRVQLSGAGIAGDGTLEDNEEALTTYTDDILIDQLRHAVRSGGQMSEQRIPFSVREESRLGLQDWWADRIDTAFMNQAAGNIAQTDPRYTGSQTPTAVTTNRIIRAGAGTTDGAVSASGSAAKFTLSGIDACVKKAKLASPLIRPLRIDGKDKYVMFLHPTQVHDMRTNTDTGQWLDIQKAAMAGMNAKKSPIYDGALGEYNGVILHESTRVPNGVDASATAHSTTRRALFCGAQAAAVGFGRGYGANQMNWEEELFDYGNKLGVAAGMIWGLKKTVFNSEDFGSIVYTTWGVE